MPQGKIAVNACAKASARSAPFQTSQGEHEKKAEPVWLRLVYCARLLHVVVFFVIINHAFAQHLYWLEILQHDRLAALGADTAGQMIDLFAVRQRCASRFRKFTFTWHEYVTPFAYLCVLSESMRPRIHEVHSAVSHHVEV